MADFDSPWKEVYDYFFLSVIRWLLRQAFEEIDRTEDAEALETKMRKLLADAETGLKRVDKLVRTVLKKSREEVLLHAETQMKPEEGFERRMFVYNYKALDKYNLPVVSIAVLGDD